MENEKIDEIIGLLFKVTELMKDLKTDCRSVATTKKEDKIEMISLKDCGKVITGLSEYSARRLALKGVVKSVRAGEGKKGKIYINKRSLIDYFSAKSLDTGLNAVYDI